MNNEAETRKTIANNAKRIRNEKKLTQEEIAYRMGISSRRILEIENAKSNSIISTLVKLANALEVDFTELVAQGINKTEADNYLKSIAAISDRDREVINLLLDFFIND